MARKVRFVCISLIFLLFFFYIKIFAQYGNIRFESLSTADGLPLENFLCIYQDSKGFIWLGTEGGLYRYDGYNFKIFKHYPGDPESISDNDVFSLIEDSSDIMWVGTYGGLNKFNMKTETFTHYINRSDDPTSLSHNEVHSMIKDRFGDLWIGTKGGGLNKLVISGDEDTTITFIHYKSNIDDNESICGNEIYSIIEDKRGTLWIGTDNGLSRYVREKNSFINYVHNPNDPVSMSRGEVYSIYEDKEGVIWIGTFGGGLNKLVRRDYDDVSLTFKHYINDPHNPASINDNSILTMHEDKSGFLWLGTWNGGLNIFNKEKEIFSSYMHNADDPTTLSSDIIYSIFEDNSGIIWIGPYSGEGLHKYNRLKEQFNPYRYYLHQPSNDKIKNVWVIYEDQTGILWVGTYEGLYKFNRESNICTKYFHNPGDPTSLSDNKVSNVFEDNSGVLWVTTHGGGISKFEREKEKFIHYKNDRDNPQSLSNDIVLSIYEDRSGTIWIGTYGGGLNKFDKETGIFFHYTHDPDNPRSISDNRIFCIYKDKAENFWLGTWSEGLSKFDREREEFTNYKHDPTDSTSISANWIGFIYEDKSGTLWIGTDEGLNKFDILNESFNRYNMKDGLPGEILSGVLEDDNGNLWLSAGNGLSRFNPKNETFRNFDISDGLQGNSFNAKAHFKTKRGELIFGGPSGWNIFHPDSLMDNTDIPTVVLTEFYLFNEAVLIGYYKKSERTVLSKSIIETSMLELTYEEKIFSIEFAALDFHAPEKNKYAYILEGFEENWNYTDASRRTATYTNLDPGVYIFRVKASNNHSVWNEEGTSLKIIILPPWWATTWAYIIYAIIIMSILYFTWKLQLRRVRIRHELEIEKVEAQKMHEVDEMKNRFFANLSHEFRTPLTLIFGPVKDIIEDCDDKNKVRRNAGIIKRNASRLYSLVNQLLDLSKLEAGKMKLETSEQNIIPLLKGYVLSFSSLAERKKIKLRFNAVEENLKAYIDKDKVEKIINNLLLNAFKFTPVGGEITVSVLKPTPKSPPNEGTFNKVISPPWRGTEGVGSEVVEISVSDNGIGIEKERLDKIFDRFYQVDGSHTRESEGTGIGLSLTKELVELHKGKIEVESQYGKGTNFKVLLPLGKDHLKSDEILEEEILEEKISEVKTDLISASESIKGKSGIETLLETDKPLILLVEDNADVRGYIINHLEEEYRILEAVNGFDGLQEAIKHIPDLIISDVMMPKMDGFELCEKLKTDERSSHIPVILLTAKATDKDKIAGYETGADDYIMKPFDNKVLQTRIKNLIEIRKKLQEKFSSEDFVIPKELSPIDVKFIKRVLKVIDKHISNENFSIEELSLESAMSREQIYKKLKALTGKSTAHFLRSIRLIKAKNMIKENLGTISEISYSVGFSSPAYFTKCFKEEFGYPPSELLPK